MCLILWAGARNDTHRPSEDERCVVGVCEGSATQAEASDQLTVVVDVLLGDVV